MYRVNCSLEVRTMVKSHKGNAFGFKYIKKEENELKRTLVLLLCTILAGSFVRLTTVRAQQPQTTTVFTDPFFVESTAIGQNFTVNINVSDVVRLYGWQTGVTFDPKVLECTGFYEGEFLNRSGQTTWWLKNNKGVNNTLGMVYFDGCCILGLAPGVNGSGQLAYATFRSVGIGVSNFHLTDVILVDINAVDLMPEEIPFEVAESFTVPVNGANYSVNITDNLTGETSPVNPPSSGLFNTSFSISDKKISFEALTVKDWFCEVIVPKELLRCNTPSEWTIRVDGAPVPYTATENATCTSLSFTHDKGNHTIEISGTQAVMATPNNLPPPPLLVATAAALGLVILTLALVDFRKTRNVRQPHERPGMSSKLL
jgi:hypothetical protein